uniref:Uncharacterized protein n=1 Tax=Glossina palpalis gambiensis TaxID=67801 RepID=A0A1B0BAY0_9MUSC
MGNCLTFICRLIEAMGFGWGGCMIFWRYSIFASFLKMFDIMIRIIGHHQLIDGTSRMFRSDIYRFVFHFFAFPKLVAAAAAAAAAAVPALLFHHCLLSLISLAGLSPLPLDLLSNQVSLADIVHLLSHLFSLAILPLPEIPRVGKRSSSNEEAGDPNSASVSDVVKELFSSVGVSEIKRFLCSSLIAEGNSSSNTWVPMKFSFSRVSLLVIAMSSSSSITTKFLSVGLFSPVECDLRELDVVGSSLSATTSSSGIVITVPLGSSSMTSTKDELEQLLLSTFTIICGELSFISTFTFVTVSYPVCVLKSLLKSCNTTSRRSFFAFTGSLLLITVESDEEEEDEHANQPALV